MIFINSLLALGALAFTVPLAIHLLFRNRFETLDWGAMRFLEAVVRVNRRRMQLRNLLLLLLRCAIPILLAFCLARPVLTGWTTLPGDQPLSMLLALDTSYSLDAKLEPTSDGESAAGPSNTRRINRLVETAKDIIQSLPRGSDVTVITSATAGRDEANDAFRGDAQAVLASLDQLQVSGRPLSIEALLSESLRKAGSSATERRQIVMLTDDAASDLSQSQLDSLASIGERRAAIKPEPALAWIDTWPASASLTSSQLDNRRVVKLEPAQSASVPGQPVVWTVELRDDSRDESGDSPTLAVDSSVDVSIDGLVIETRPVSFRDGIATLTVETTFETAGRHVVEVALASDDNFAADNRLRADYLVLPPIDVWLVDGNVSDKPLQSDTDFLAIALSPFSLAGDKAVDLFRTTKIGVRELTSQKDETPRIVVLADVGAIRTDDAKWLSDFVEQQGGTLIVFAGPATEDSAWEKQFVSPEGTPLLPMSWGEVKTWDAASTGAKIDENQLTYPPLASFSREAKGTLATVGVMSYRMMKPRTLTTPSQDGAASEDGETAEADATAETQKRSQDANVIMRLENGDPLMVVREAGKGRVMQVATTANDRWTSLPRRLAFVPLMQRLLMHLAIGENRIATPSAGEPIVVDLATIASESAEAWTATTPDGRAVNVTPRDGILRLGETDLAGIYRFESSDSLVFHAAVNVPEADLKRTPSDPAVRDTAAKSIGATRYSSPEAFRDDDSTRRFGRGIWRYVLLALLAAMIIEPVLQQRGGRVSS